MRILWQDTRYGLRQLRKSPGFTAVAVLSLALGIGANTGFFSITNGILYKSLPVRNPHELRVINWTGHKVPGELFYRSPMYFGSQRSFGSFPYPAYLDFAKQAEGFSDLFAFSYGGDPVTIDAGGVPILANARMVSGNFFKGYGAEVLFGRPITPDDDRRDAPPVAILTYPFWQRVFGLDPHVIGRTLTVGRTGFTIIGVLPRSYVGPLAGQRNTDFCVPVAAQPQLRPELSLTSYNRWWAQIMGRLAPGADEAQAQASLQLLFSQVVNRSEMEIDQPGILLQKGQHGVLSRRGMWARDFWQLQSLVGLVLLIACANLAGLLLARGAARQHEMAVRAAMGAGRWRLIRQSLTESMILSLGGICLGLLLSIWIRAAVGICIIDCFLGNRNFNLQIDAHVFVFALAAGVVTTLLSGLLPALRAGNTDPSAGLKDSGSLGAPRLRLGKVLVTAQVGMSILFVVVGGLLCRTLINLYRMDPGFDTENLLLVPIDPDKSLSPPEFKNFEVYYDVIRRKIAGIPGVRSVALSNTTLTGGHGWSPKVSIPSRPDARPRDSIALSVSEGYFATMGINLLAGRGFNAADTEDSQRVVIVNEEFGRLCFPEKNPVGQFIMIDDEEHIIVGLCSNHKYCGLRRGISPILYRPHSQYELHKMTCMMRSVLPPMSLVPAVREAVAEIDRNLLLEGIMSQKLAIKESFRLERLMTSLFGSFALLALALSCIGLYGIMAYNVARRTGELGIRMALGARPWDVAWSVLRGALILAGIGVAIGLPVALALSRLMRSLFYGIEPHDPLTMIGAILIMLTVAALAAWIPARRAAKVDPMVALRYQ
ncbi:MAG: ABC transporter permease [Phycisphaerales bacterium]|nr:MAG: ABC transporter permease [Phycisphaerales bacterium]